MTEESFQDYSKSLEFEEHGEVHYNLALIYEERREYEKALDELNQAVALGPERFPKSYCACPYFLYFKAV